MVQQLQQQRAVRQQQRLKLAKLWVGKALC
jgi:hypothetical protein